MEVDSEVCPRLAITPETTRWIGMRSRAKRAWEMGIQIYPAGEILALHADALLAIESEDGAIRHEEWEAKKVENHRED